MFDTVVLSLVSLVISYLVMVDAFSECAIRLGDYALINLISGLTALFQPLVLPRIASINLCMLVFAQTTRRASVITGCTYAVFLRPLVLLSLVLLEPAG